MKSVRDEMTELRKEMDVVQLLNKELQGLLDDARNQAEANEK